MASGQTLKSSSSNTRSFNTAIAQLHSNLNNGSVPAEEIPVPAARVFNQLVREASGSTSGEEFSWELRVVKGLTGNSFSLPDGAVYVDEEMVQLLGNDPGLWAAILAHEIEHVTQRHWTKRTAFQESLRDPRRNWSFMQMGAFPVVFTSSTPADQERELADFSQDLELEADVGSLGLMARSGFHPDFVTALYHLMKAEEGNQSAAHFLASHPRWDVRESHLRKSYSAALAEFAKLWPDSALSPGGKPPVLAYVGRPEASFADHHSSAQVSLPIRCENSSGGMEILLLLRRLRAQDIPPSEQTSKMRQEIDCTSGRANVNFVLGANRPHAEADVEFYVMDSRGWVLARSSKLKVRY